jgi:hypothetical protein
LLRSESLSDGPLSKDYSPREAFSENLEEKLLVARSHKIDTIAFWTFLAVFLAFSVIYWIVCTQLAEAQLLSKENNK